MNTKLIMVLALGALFIAAPGCSSTRHEHKGTAHMHNRPSSNGRKKIHRHIQPVRDDDAPAGARGRP